MGYLVSGIDEKGKRVELSARTYAGALDIRHYWRIAGVGQIKIRKISRSRKRPKRRKRRGELYGWNPWGGW